MTKISDFTFTFNRKDLRGSPILLHNKMDHQLRSARDLFKRMSLVDDRLSRKLENHSMVNLNEMWGACGAGRRAAERVDYNSDSTSIAEEFQREEIKSNEAPPPPSRCNKERTRRLMVESSDHHNSDSVQHISPPYSENHFQNSQSATSRKLSSDVTNKQRSSSPNFDLDSNALQVNHSKDRQLGCDVSTSLTTQQFSKDNRNHFVRSSDRNSEHHRESSPSHNSSADVRNRGPENHSFGGWEDDKMLEANLMRVEADSSPPQWRGFENSSLSEFVPDANAQLASLANGQYNGVPLTAVDHTEESEEEETALQTIALAEGWKCLSIVKDASKVTDMTVMDVAHLDTQRIYAELSFNETPQRPAKFNSRKKGEILSPPPTAWDDKTHPVRIQDCPASPKTLNEQNEWMSEATAESYKIQKRGLHNRATKLTKEENGKHKNKNVANNHPRQRRATQRAAVPPQSNSHYLHDDVELSECAPTLPSNAVPTRNSDEEVFKELGELINNQRQVVSEDVEFQQFQRAIRKKQPSPSEVLYAVKILLFDGNSATVHVSPTDDLQSVAREFAELHSLPDAVIPALAMKLQEECLQHQPQPVVAPVAKKRVPLSTLNSNQNNNIKVVKSAPPKPKLVTKTCGRSRAADPIQTIVPTKLKSRTPSVTSSRSHSRGGRSGDVLQPLPRKRSIPNPGIRLYNQGMRQRSATASEAREARRLREEREVRLATFHPSISVNAKLLYVSYLVG